MQVLIQRNYDFPDFLRQSPLGRGEWKGIRFSELDIEPYDLLICLNPPNAPIFTNLAKERRWLITQEPPVDQKMWMKSSFHHFGKIISQLPGINVTNTQSALPWHVNLSYDTLIKMKAENKPKVLSAVTSNLNVLPFHKKRRAFLDFLNQEGLKFDYFGKGHHFVKNKEDVLLPYKYSICMENSSFPNYWTEKIADCYLSFTMPIYFGCPNIDNYFPKGSYVLLDLNDFEGSKHTIEKAIREKHWERNFDNIVEARNLILNEYQFFPWVSGIIKNTELGKANYTGKYSIPAYTPPKSFLKRLKNYVKSSF